MMRRSSEPEERAQFTVAELLARYGESAPPTARRHRRAAEEPAVAAELRLRSRSWNGIGLTTANPWSDRLVRRRSQTR